MQNDFSLVLYAGLLTSDTLLSNTHNTQFPQFSAMPPKRKASASTEGARPKRIRASPSSDTIAIYHSNTSASSSFSETPDNISATTARRTNRRTSAKTAPEDVGNSITVQPTEKTRGRSKKEQVESSEEPRVLEKRDLNGATKEPPAKPAEATTKITTGSRKKKAQVKSAAAVEAAPRRERDIFDIPSSDDELLQATTASLTSAKKPPPPPPRAPTNTQKKKSDAGKTLETGTSKSAPGKPKEKSQPTLEKLKETSKPAREKPKEAKEASKQGSEKPKETSERLPSLAPKPVRRSGRKPTTATETSKLKATKSHKAKPTENENAVSSEATIVVQADEREEISEKLARLSRHRRTLDDEDTITAGGKITPAPSKKPLLNPRFSLGTDSIVDPFAMPVPEAADVEKPGKSSTPKKTAKSAPKSKSQPISKEGQLPADLNLTSDDVTTLQHHVLSKLTSRSPIPLIDLTEEYNTVHQLLLQTVTAGESNSLLLIGSRGSGKSAILSTAISNLQVDHPGEFYTVRLSGLLQTDDRLAIREIYRQLGQELEFDADAPGSFADTLSKLLAMLSHPDELNPEGEDEALDDGEEPHKTATAVIFILDEFDLFASHPRQTLLYNLFDIAQSRKAPIAVIGCTTTIEILDRLEKRVKSRFSHRTVHCKLPDSIDQYWEIVKGALEAPGPVDSGNDRKRYYEAWNNTWIAALREDPGFDRLLKREFAFTRQLARILNSLLPTMASLSVSQPFPTFPLFPAPTPTTASGTIHAPTLAPPPSNLALLPSLSDLQLSLLISATRLEVFADAETVNWTMIYDEYLQVCSKMVGTAAVVKRSWRCKNRRWRRWGESWIVES
ncbi:hypothetical protein EX30DRAFT_94469 [Ascodesmis nigricans]|uniref:Origin recognition complex subunit 4 n=1 Tax=Ascodesmis nigricans TaxID=341454 RepID=A0A4S2N442_9PEZI|nr:hypothetical protein EX30DRAFT_94469 [Ascodesmis nigricans]